MNMVIWSVSFLFVHCDTSTIDPTADLMVTDVISCTVDTDQEEVARLAARYNFLAIPVVDSGNHLVRS